MHLVSQAKWQL